ncbi:MAG: sialidase family protein [Planctomycetota bacterium]
MRPTIAVVLVFILARAAGAAEVGEVRVLCDFEKDSVAKLKVEYKRQEDALYQARISGCYGCNFTATKGPATSGEWALSEKFGACADVRWLPGLRDGSHLPSRKLFTTSYSLAQIGPTDWSGFDALEFNIWKDKDGPVSIALALEDAVISPPVVRRFKLEASTQWHTLRVPLAVAGELLDLKKMVNFWTIVEQSPRDVEVRLDDVRLVKGEVKGEYPVLLDESPVKESHQKLVAELVAIVPSEAKHNVNKVEGEIQPPPPGPDARKFSVPAQIEKFEVLDMTKMAKDANTRRTFPYGLEFFDDKSAILCVPPYAPGGLAYTSDAGRTWTKASGCFGGGNHWRCEISGDNGDLLFVGLGQCSGGGLPTGFYFRRVVHAEGGWKLGPAYPVDRDTRHCQDNYDILRLDSGRIWVAWNHCLRDNGFAVWARYSDDDGKTWKPGGETPLIPGSVGAGLGTDPKFFPFGEGVGCLWQDNERRIFFAAHDGKAWSPAAPLPARQINSAASADGKTIYAVVGGGREGPARILRGDGKTWTEETKLPAVGYLTVQKKSGRLHCAYASSSGDTNHVFLISRGPDGAWSEPKPVAGPADGSPKDTPLIVSVPRWSPEEFVPVAIYGLHGGSNVVWAQVVKLPIKDLP